MLAACMSSCTSSPQYDLPPLRETFSRYDNDPFGAAVFHNQIGQRFSHNTINHTTDNFAKTWSLLTDTGSLYICISKHLYLSPSDKDAMLNYVNAGNSMFISCEDIDSTLLNELACRDSVIKMSEDYLYPGLLDHTAEKTETLDNNGMHYKYSYYYYPFINYFSEYDTSTTQILGRNENGLPDFILVSYGKGYFYLHCEPRAFSNYFLLQNDNFKYLQNAFSLASEIPVHVFWDDHYYKHNYRDAADDNLSGGGSAFPWMLVIVLLIYIVFNGKRRQRVIREIAPNTNSTMAFAETMGRLYYQEKNNKNITDKMITYFLEHTRNQYFINTSQLNDIFIDTLSRKSSVQKSIVESLIRMIVKFQQLDRITDKEVLALSKQIEKFHKNKQ